MTLKRKTLSGIRRTGILVMALVMLLTTPLLSFGTVDTLGIRDTGTYLLNTIPGPEYGMVGGDWTVLALARSDLDLPASYTDEYFKNAEKVLKEQNGELSKNKYSEYSRLILGLTAVGKTSKEVGDYNLLAKLTDLSLIEKQGINGPIYALLALDSIGYDSLLREELIGSILKRELSGGGFALSGNVADPDVTAAALQALSKYRVRTEVKAAIERALAVLSKAQSDTGGFAGWAAGNVENAESIAQVILALTALGIDPLEDQRFIKQSATDGGKNGSTGNITLIDALLTFRNKDGSYCHLKGSGPDIMATEQAFMAMVSYGRLLKGQNHIFRMGDIAGSKYTNKVLLNGEYLSFDVEPIIVDGRTLVPMRAIFEALGARVEWNGELRQVQGELNGGKVQLVIGNKTAKVNGIVKELDVAAVIKNGRTLVPLRFVSDSLGAEVDWDTNSRTATVDMKL